MNQKTSSLLIAPSQVNSLVTKAQGLYNSGSYTDCLTLCEKIYDLDTYRTDNLLLIGAVHFQLRNYSESVFYNQQCIRVDPHFAEAYSNLGNALKELGDLKGATQFYLKAVKLKPRYSDAYNNLASSYMLQGQIQQAMETYQMALVLNPNLVDAHTNLGNLYKATGDIENAKQCYL
jgi:protein O-GlcNAc transferase